MHNNQLGLSKKSIEEGIVILINKEKNWTSFDVVKKIKNLIRAKFDLKKIKVGHAGTLDPLATGLLIICTGKYTKKISEIQDLQKTYTGEITLGAKTPSFDLETEIDEKFDLALSLEVAEHLQPSSSKLFIKSITSSSDLIMFGAAFLAQPGTNHINTRLHSFWAHIFSEYSFKVYDIFRPEFCGNNKIMPWYQQNTFLYVRAGSKYEEDLYAKNFYPIENINFLDLIHPWLYGHFLNQNKLLLKKELHKLHPPVK